jgi:F0F1-type ATP synthase assembly protein I
MIKNLLNADEEPPPGTKVVIEDSVVNQPAETQSAEAATARERLDTQNTPEDFEISADTKSLTKPSAPADETTPLDEDSESMAALRAELESLAPEDLELLEKELGTVPNIAPIDESKGETALIFEPIPEQTAAEKKPETTAEINYESAAGTIFQSDYTPPSTGETIRNSGLAYSAAIVLFGSVVFMMIFGWFADLLLGSSPWGLVGGIILGGIIGFIQLFRITSQIFKK